MRNTFVIAITLTGLTACSTTDFSQSVPALLPRGNQEGHAEIKRVVSEALGGRRVSLSKDVLTADSRLIIEPKQHMDPFGNPANGRMLGKPDHFMLKTHNGTCALYQEKTGEYLPLSGVTCTPA